MFLSFDRPEDRPNTLWWLFTQILVGYIVLVPAVILFVQNGLAGIIWIPFIHFLMTIVEAFSPHTWDTPTLYLAGYGALYGITRLL